jgi:2-polyprenyl-6-methoxyphenol hydroxylase-like FAD-dependent oxidoreductase
MCSGGVEAVLEPTGGGPREVVQCPWLLAADGARSTVRQQVGVQFVGSSFPREWHLADAPLRTDLAADPPARAGRGLQTVKAG